MGASAGWRPQTEYASRDKSGWKQSCVLHGLKALYGTWLSAWVNLLQQSLTEVTWVVDVSSLSERKVLSCLRDSIYFSIFSTHPLMLRVGTSWGWVKLRQLVSNHGFLWDQKVVLSIVSIFCFYQCLSSSHKHSHLPFKNFLCFIVVKKHLQTRL